MRKLFIALLVLTCVSCSAQLYNYTPWYYYKFKLQAKNLVADSTATIPSDTLSTAPNNSLAVKGDSLYVKTAGAWHGVASTTGLTGGVTSIGATASGALSVSGSPVTSSGTLTFGWTGGGTDYVKGNGTLSNFTTDVKAIGDARYAIKLHTHLFEQLTNGVSSVRNLFSVGAGLSYNPATGVFSALDTLDPASYALISQLNDSMTMVRDSLTALAGRIGTGGGATDTASLSNRINQKQNLSDTTTWDATRAWVLSQGYGTGTSVDTTSLSNRINQKQNALTLTTTGTSGAATLTGSTLNIPQYGSGVTSLAAIGSTPNANGATVSGTTLNLEPASATFGGIVTTGTQTFGGSKRFSNIGVGTDAGSAKITSSTISGNALNAVSSSGVAVVIQSTSNYAQQSLTFDAPAVGVFSAQPVSTNTIQPILILNRYTQGTPANNIGGSINFVTQTPSANQVSTQIISKWTTATDASRTSQFEITGVDNAVTKTVVQVTGAGLLILAQGAPEYTDNAAAVSAGLSVGTVYRSGDVLKIVH